MVNKKYVLAKAPFVRRADLNKINTKNIMKDVLIALIPFVLFAWYKNGLYFYFENNSLFYYMLYPLAFILIGALSAFLIEALYYLIILKEEDCFKKSWNNYSIISGLLLALILPINTPIWVLIIAVIFAIIIAKMLYGGFGHNIFNPALVGYIFVFAAYYNVIAENKIFNDIDFVSSATPLSGFKSVLYGNTSINDLINSYGGLFKMFLGFIPGAIGETSALLCIIAFIYLSYKKAINPIMSLIYIFTCFVYSFILGMFINVDSLFNFAIFNILNGGIMFASVFMVTEPVTSPRNIKAKYIYTFFIAIISITLRFLSNYPEGVSTAILFMNMLSPSLDTYFAKLNVSNNKRKKIITYIVIFTIIFLITIFNIYSILEKK